MTKNVYCNCNGNIKSIEVEEGDYVQDGQLLALLEDNTCILSTENGVVEEILVDEESNVSCKDVFLIVECDDEE